MKCMDSIHESLGSCFACALEMMRMFNCRLHSKIHSLDCDSSSRIWKTCGIPGHLNYKDSLVLFYLESILMSCDIRKKKWEIRHSGITGFLYDGSFRFLNGTLVFLNIALDEYVFNVGCVGKRELFLREKIVEKDVLSRDILDHLDENSIGYENCSDLPVCLAAGTLFSAKTFNCIVMTCLRTWHQVFHRKFLLLARYFFDDWLCSALLSVRG